MSSGDCLVPDITLGLLVTAAYPFCPEVLAAAIPLGFWSQRTPSFNCFRRHRQWFSQLGFGSRFSVTTSVEAALGESLAASVSSLDLRLCPGTVQNSCSLAVVVLIFLAGSGGLMDWWWR
ncbi:unnamed protein product [Brassica rapa]|uniref:Uncharacterized protein n=1 Tax=Brassica campestris TaxID=3711 RepID=A0A8D9H0R5_BRACM|nr:unnamed protein product [Brassica rapa]